MKIQFRDLNRQYQRVKKDIYKHVEAVISATSFISGPQVRELEEQLAEYVGVKHCISCANGTDAITIALMAYGVGQGDAVFVPDFTFFSSGECPAALGAIPVFVDVRNDTYNMDAVSLERAILTIQAEGKLKPKAVIAVDLFGLPADYETIQEICNRYELLLLEDGAQGFGGSIVFPDGKKKIACASGDISTTSFFPAKPLGCYGDGGAIFTDDDTVATICRSIAVHGKDMLHPEDPMSKYNNERLGLNSRLDTIQAAVLLAKLKAFRDYELCDVNHVASYYTEQLRQTDDIQLPFIPENMYSSWAQYTIQLSDRINRANLQHFLSDKGVPTMIYYPKPMHKQGAFTGTVSAEADCPVTEDLCRRVLCLPIHPYIKEEEIIYICDILKSALRECG